MNITFKQIVGFAIAFVLVWTAAWVVPVWSFRQIKDVNPHTASLGEQERQKQLDACIKNGGKPESWSDGTFKKCN